MKWLSILGASVPLAISGLLLWFGGIEHCNAAHKTKQAVAAVSAVLESQVNEDIINAAPPSDDAPCAPVLCATLDRVRGK